jgi:hypothetical protein
MPNITRSAASNKSSSSSSSAASAVGVVPPAVPRSVEGVVGAAAFLQVRATQAAVIANATANDAAAVSFAHGIILDKHRTIFLQRAFGINPEGMAVDQAVLHDRLKKYKSIRTVDQYNDMVLCLPHWGEDEYLATMTSFCVSGNVFLYLNIGLRMGRHLQRHVDLTPQLILQLPMQLLVLQMLQKQIWTYVSAAVTH